MDDAERAALAALSFNWAPTPDDVWRPSPFHVDGLHQQTEQTILDGLADATRSDDSSPIGVAVLGQRGSGKTHLLGWVRRRTQADGGYFFLISLLDASTFWRSAALSVLDGLTREVDGQATQLAEFLRRIADRVAAPRSVRRAVTGETALSRAALEAFVDVLRKASPQVGRECQNTARALVLLGSENYQEQDVGHNFLSSNDEEEPGERARWGIRRERRSAQQIVRDMSRLLAMTGPTVVAVDQIDLLIAQSVKSAASDQVALDPQEKWRQALLVEQIAGGLMSLREWTRRTLSVVSCLPTVWELVKANATDTVQDRFREAVRLKNIPSAELGREIVERRFAARFEKLGFTPPYPSWPVRSEAFAEAIDFTPRELLKTVDAHVRSCLRDGEVRELTHLIRPRTTPVPGPAVVASALGSAAMAELDARFDELRDTAKPADALDPKTEDKVVPKLLAAGLTAWIAELGAAGEAYGQDPLPGAKPDLHARLRRGLAENREDEIHWCFRAVVAPHHIAALNRIRNAVTAAGLTEGVSKRRLFLLRNADWNRGPRTQEVVKAFEKAGGQRLKFSDDDIKTLDALRRLVDDTGVEKLRPWLVARQPAHGVGIFQHALADVADETRPVDEGPTEPTGPMSQPSPDAVTVGAAVGGGYPVTVELVALRKHTAIFAGSGSGKTVLIRRLVEECARQGVSAIVLDPNNDLARLGDPWPEPPTGWGDGDAARARDYLANTDVVVWTPRREAGRPLSFQPLPDFSSVLDHPDEFSQAVDAAVAALAPRGKVDGNTNKAHIGRAVLRQALTHYGRQQRSDLRGFVGLLASLPPRVSELDNAGKLAADLAQTLTATMVNDPLFGGDGTPVDPGLLLTPPAGKRARVSVVSFVGLPSDEQRQSFVNQLQLALFAWIKRHPAGDRPLGGLFVMDEAQTLAPSGAMTACTQSTLALTAQARKYGLGLVFATQAPKGLHNQIPGNASTQFFGRLNAPVQIAAAQEMARNKGSEVTDIGKLGTGQFYAAIGGSEFVKIQAPLCLSHHPASPLTTEEVLERAARDRS